MKIIKINLLWIILWILAFTIWLNVISKLFFSWDSVEIVNTTTSVSMNEFLSGYQASSFSKIKLKDATTLEWYIPVSGALWDSLSLMSLQKNVKIENYDVMTTKKPLDTSLTDMGILLTGNTIIDIEYEEKSFLSSLFFDNILPILILVAIFVIAMRLMWGKGMGGMMPFGNMMNVGKLAGTDKNAVKTKFSDVIGMKKWNKNWPRWSTSSKILPNIIRSEQKFLIEYSYMDNQE